MVVELTPADPLHWRNETADYQDVTYASVTAKTVVTVTVKVNGELLDCVHVGGGNTHSWWTSAGGKLLGPHGVPPDGKLVIAVAGGPATMRIDWQ